MSQATNEKQMKTYVIADDFGHHLIAARSLDHALSKHYSELACQGADDMRILAAEMAEDGYDFWCTVRCDGVELFSTIQSETFA
jgi:hypothetical protein